MKVLSGAHRRLLGAADLAEAIRLVGSAEVDITDAAPKVGAAVGVLFGRGDGA